MADWSGNHKLPPLQCSTNTTVWSETITPGFTKVRAQHVLELRTAIDAELTRRELPTITWGDAIVADTTNVRKAHVDELRAALAILKSGDCATDSYYCPEDTSSCVETGSCGSDSGGSWESIVADVTNIRANHWLAIRNIINQSETTCICESERCEFCSDCGYRYSSCGSDRPCYCDESKYASGCNPRTSVVNCGSINAGGTHPFKTFPGSTPHDDYVPWAMGTGPTGSNWSAYWTCKCSPFTW